MKIFSKTAIVTLKSFAFFYIIFAIVLWDLGWISCDYDGIVSTRILYVIFSLFPLYIYAVWKFFNDLD